MTTSSPFSILSYNTFCMSPLINKTTKIRRPLIASALLELDEHEQPDIICLQEAFNESTIAIFKEILFPIYPHFATPPTCKWFQASSGLFIASKHEIVESQFEPFKNLVGSDSWSKKGFLRARIKFNGSTYINVVNTHLQADPDTAPCWWIRDGMARAVKSRLQNVNEILASIEICREKNEITFVAGDFNDSEISYEKLGTDSYKFCNNMKDKNSRRKSSTSGPAVSNLGSWSNEKPDFSERLDFIFVVREFENGEKVKVQASKVFHKIFVDSRGQDLSDHLPLLSSFYF